jgi:sulfur carrier protein ThiS
MMRVSVKSFPRGEVDKKVELPNGSTALDLFKALSMHPDNWVASRDDKVIPDDTPLGDGDSIKLLSVVSGG